HLTWCASKEIAKSLIAKIDSIVDINANIILTGDFNYNQTSLGYAEMVKKYQDAYDIAQLRLATNGTTNDMGRDYVRQERVDHIFVTDNFIVDKHAIITDIYYYTDSVRFPSDHYPVMSVLRPKNSTVTNDNRNKIKACSYNIGGSTTTGPDSWQNRLSLIYKSILIQNVDIIGIQKTNLSQLNQLKDSLNYNNSVNYRTIGSNINTSILYNNKKYEVCTNNGTPATGIFSLTSNVRDQTNICTWVKMKDISNSFEFYVFNARLDNNSITNQDYCISTLTEKISEIAEFWPAFLTGTFSFDHSISYYARLNSSCIVKDSYWLSPVKYNSDRTINDNYLTDMNNSKRKDFVFISPHFIPIRHGSPTTLYWTKPDNIPSQEFLNTLDMNQAREDIYNPTPYINVTPRFSSDHFPVIVELEYYNCN
ncbi:MAG: hypothetical protein LIO93_02540, partial [Bacteroidales bacterium]|nr:hypothetical protein [Bacteroidales bacterium]